MSRPFLSCECFHKAGQKTTSTCGRGVRFFPENGTKAGCAVKRAANVGSASAFESKPILRRFPMFAKLTSALFALALVAGTVAAQPDPKKLDDKKLVTKVYGVKHLIGERGKAGGVADADAVVKLIFETFPQM